MNCRICKSETCHAFTYTVMGKYSAEFIRCPQCEFFFASDPFWLEEAYKNPITLADTGLLSRNVEYSHKIAVLLYHLFEPQGRYLDFAGGYGVFSRLMRDVGFEFYHYDPYTENLFAKGLEWNTGITGVECITCFECVEHLPDPMPEIRKMMSISENLIFSTELIPEKVPPLTWHYFGFDHGQHISFYSKKTLSTIAEMMGVKLISTDSLHIFSNRNIPEKNMRRLLKQADRIVHPFSSRTHYKRVVRKMRKIRQIHPL